VRTRTKKRKHRFAAFRRDRGFVARLALTVLAAICLVVGVAGIVLPLLPGWPFIAVGLVLLAGVDRRLRRWLHRFLNRHPKIDHVYLKIRRAPSRVQRTPDAGAA
jgi:uncharacterized membrane protein YbaN (DUF454 family)